MDDFRLDQRNTVTDFSYTIMLINNQTNLPSEILSLVGNEQIFSRWHNCIMSLNKLLTRVGYARELVIKKGSTYHWRCIQNKEQ